MKKFLSLLLALVMVLGLITGCTNNDTPDTTVGSGDSQPNAGTTETPKELRTISILCVKNKMSMYPAMDFENWENNETYQVFTAKLAELGLKLEYEVIEAEQYDEAVKTRLIAGVNLPDIVYNPNLSDAEAISLGQAGVVLDCMELINTYDADGSILSYMYEVAGTAMPKIVTEDNQMFWFPYVSGRLFVDENGELLENNRGDSVRCMLVRKDWMDACNIEYKYIYTPEEVYDMLATFRQEDANGNGVQDEVIGTFGTRFTTGFEAAFGLGYRLMSAPTDGSGVLCNVYADGFADYIRLLQKLYQANLIDSAVLNGDDVLNTNRAATTLSYAAEDWLEEGIVGFENTALFVPIIIDVDGGADGFNLPVCDNVQTLYTKWFVTSECEDLQAVVDLMDFIYTREYADLAKYGLEGVTYEIDEAGNRIYLEGHPNYEEGSTAFPLENTVATNALPNNVYEVVTKELCLSNLTTKEYYAPKVEFVTWLWDNWESATYTDNKGPWAMATEEESEIIAKYEAQINTYVNELILDLVIGEKSLDNLDQYIAELESIGLKEYVAVYEAQYARYQAITAAANG